MTRTHWLLLGALALPACREDDFVSFPPEPSPPPTLQLSLAGPSPIVANVPAPQGSVGGATVTRSEGFNGAISMSAESVPTGWSVTFSPAIIGGNENSASVVIMAPANVVAGSYSFDVRASVIGVASAAGTMTVVANVEQGN